MSRIQEAREVLKHIHQAWERKQGTAMLMITEVQGSAYRQPGAKMMMAADGRMFGTLSGGCLEGDLFGWAEQAIQARSPLARRYDLSENELWSLGIGCKGKLEILILPVEPEDDFWRMAAGMIDKEQAVSLVLEIPEGIRVLLGQEGKAYGDDGQLPEEVRRYALSRAGERTRAEVMKSGERRFVIDTMRPNERLIVCGAGHDAVPVVNLAGQVGFSVTVLDPRSEFNDERRFPGVSHMVIEPRDADPETLSSAWWLIMNHHQNRDEAALALALKSQPRYIGVLGPLSRTQEMLNHIGKTFSDGPLHAPVGLDLGSETIDEVAVSIVSELMAVRHNRSAAPLNGRTKIHA
jgi:xanthine/CO dehydrogenase XdhC/CoxF family maturation factor